MVYPIVTYPHPVLEKKAQKVPFPLSDEHKQFIDDMIETIHVPDADPSIQHVGLAAPQVGKSLQICLIELEGKLDVMINPKIISYSRKTDIQDEGCLSFPGKFIPVERASKVKFKYRDREGNKHIIKASGFFARVVQHEFDHLDGVLMIRREMQS